MVKEIKKRQQAGENTDELNIFVPKFASSGDFEQVRKLAELGVNLDTKNASGMTPAEISQKNDYKETLAVLEEYGADLTNLTFGQLDKFGYHDVMCYGGGDRTTRHNRFQNWL